MTFGIYQDRIGRGAAWSKDQKKKRGKQGEPVLAWSFVDGWRFATKLDLFGLLCALCRLTSWWMKPRGSCKRLPFWQKTTKLMKNAQNNKSPSLKPKTKSYWSIKLINVTHCKKQISIMPPGGDKYIRDRSRYQIGWIFGKIPNGLWPNPPHFINYIAIFLYWIWLHICKDVWGPDSMTCKYMISRDRDHSEAWGVGVNCRLELLRKFIQFGSVTCPLSWYDY